MIRTPHVARYANEERRLVVGPPPIYGSFVRGTILAGLAMIAIGLLDLGIPPYREWWLFVGTGVAFAGFLAWASMDAVSFDFRARSYSRRQGPGFSKRVTRGSLDALDALQLVAAPGYHGTGTVTYSLVLHWKGGAEPPLPLVVDTRRVAGGYPAAAGAGPLRAWGVKLAEKLGVTLYDNAHL